MYNFVHKSIIYNIKVLKYEMMKRRDLVWPKQDIE